MTGDLWAEGLLTGRGADIADVPLADALAGLRTLAAGPAPVPDSELVRMFARGLVAHRRRQRARRVAVAGLVGSATLGLSGVAAAHDALPGPVQSVVARVFNDLTPLHIGAASLRPASQAAAAEPAAPAALRPAAHDADPIVTRRHVTLRAARTREDEYLRSADPDATTDRHARGHGHRHKRGSFAGTDVSASYQLTASLWTNAATHADRVADRHPGHHGRHRRR
jgi:hypothetical protein